MPNAITALVSLVKASPAGTAIGGRIRPKRGKIGDPHPYAIFDRVSGERDKTTDGPNGYAKTTIEVEWWATTYGEASNIAELAETAINGYHGDEHGVTVHSVELVDDGDAEVVGGDDGQNAGPYGVRQQFLFRWHRPA